MAKSVSQIEYDVTAYRNVLDQLLTLQGTLDSLNKGLRVYLAKNLGSTPKRSGWAMRKWGGKDRYRWSRKVASLIGLSPVRAYKDTQQSPNSRRHAVWLRRRRYLENNGDAYDRFVVVSDKAKVFNGNERKRIRRQLNRLENETKGHSGNPDRIRQQVYDVLSLVRNLQWEMNRLRVELPFDLRQLTAQLNRHASDLQGNAPTGVELYLQTKQFAENWLPKMQHRIRKRIEEAKLAEKVAEENMRRESEATKKKKPEPATSPRSPELATSPAPEKATVDKAKEQARIAAQVKAALQKAKQENEAEITTMAKEQGDSPGTGNGAVVAGILALLAIAGAG